MTHEKSNPSISEHEKKDSSAEVYRFTRAEIYATLTLCIAGLSYFKSSSDEWKKGVAELRAEIRTDIRDIRLEIDRIREGKR